MFQTCAAEAAGKELKLFEYDSGEMGPDEVEVRVESCSICHSDFNMLNNDWGMTPFSFVPGHEVIGVVEGGTSLQDFLFSSGEVWF